MAERNKKRIIAIIPARMASTRFPGKPLVKILGLEMIEHVRRRLQLCRELAEVLVATCDPEIKETVEKYGGRAIMTSKDHQRCTDRVAEAVRTVDADVIVNVQGDEPMITPRMISLLIKQIVSDRDCHAANLVSPIEDREDFVNPNVVKTVCDSNGNVLYFSREPIPSDKKTGEIFTPLRQLGIIGFTKDFLLDFAKLPQTPLEKIESIDMLRMIEHGYKLKSVIVTDKIYGIDTAEELKKVENIMREDKLLIEYMGEK